MTSRMKVVDSLQLISEKQPRRTSKLPKLPNRRNVGEKEKSKWQVESLPKNWYPKRKSSKKIRAYLTIQQTLHDACMQKFKLDMIAVNEELEAEVVHESHNVKHFVRKLADVAQDELEKIKINLRKEDFISRESFEIVLSTINYETDTCSEKVEKFYEFLSNIERLRAERTKTILRKTYAKLHDISHKLPEELQDFFENKIKDTNEVTLSNHRIYNDLYMNLVSKLENDRRLWLQEYNDRREAYIYMRKKYYDYGGDLKNIFDPNLPLLPISEGDEDDKNTVEERCRIYAECIRYFELGLLSFKAQLEAMITKIFEGDFDDVVHIDSEELADEDKVKSSVFLEADNDDVFEELYSTCFDDPTFKCVNEFTFNMLDKWQEFTNLLQDEIEQATNVLATVQHLWDPHYERVYELKELFEGDLKKFVEKNAGKEYTSFYTINSTVDRLRQSSTEEELKGSMAELSKSTQKNIKEIISHHNKEINFFEKFMKYMEEEIKICVCEMKDFVANSPEMLDVDATIQRGRRSRIQLKEPEPEPLLMTTLKMKIRCLHSWIYGLNETINTALASYEDFIAQQSIQWITLRKIVIGRRIETKVDLYRPRFKRIYYNVYRIRLAELKQHEQLLDKHSEGIKIELKKLKEATNNSVPSYDVILDEYSKKVKEIEEKSKNANVGSLLYLYQNQLDSLKFEVQKQILQVKEEFIKNCNEKINKTSYTNLCYLKYIRFFNEGGNYTLKELKHIKGQIKKLQKLIRKITPPLLKEIENSYNKKLADINLETHGIEDTFSKIKEELEFLETVKFEVNNVRNGIKRETEKVKMSVGNLHSTFGEVKMNAEDHLGDLEYLGDFFKDVGKVESSFGDLRNKLIQQKLFKLNQDLFKVDDDKKDFLRSNLVELIKSTARFDSVLFEYEAADGNDYIARIVNILFKSLEKTDEVAKNFYSKHSNFHTKGLAHNIQDFMAGLLAKYLYYQLQCEEVWLKVSMDYIQMIVQILEYLKEYCERTVGQFVNWKLGNLRDICDEYMGHVKECQDLTEKSYRGIHNRLLPLHGFPPNHKMLESLCIEMENLTSETVLLQEDVMDQYEQFKQLVEDSFVEFRREMLIVDEKVKDVIDEFEKFILYDETFSKQVRNRIEYFGEIITCNNLFGTSTGVYDDIVGNLHNKLMEFKRDLRVKVSDLTLFRKSLDKISQTTSTSTASQKSELSIHFQKFIDIYKEKMRFCIENMEHNQDFLAISTKWNDIWVDDVKRVKLLYTVKYKQESSAELSLSK